MRMEPIAGFVPADDIIDPALALALADELVALTASLSDLAYDLGSDAATLRRHMSSLQAIDHITQVQMAIVGVLRTRGHVADRLATITLEDLAASLAIGCAAHGPGGDRHLPPITMPPEPLTSTVREGI